MNQTPQSILSNQGQSFSHARRRFRSVSKKRPRSQEKIKPSRIVDSDPGYEEESFPNPRGTAYRPTINVKADDEIEDFDECLTSARNQMDQPHEEEEEVKVAVPQTKGDALAAKPDAPQAQEPSTTKSQVQQVRVVDIAQLLTTLSQAQQFQVNGQHYEIDAQNQEFQNLLKYSKLDQIQRLQQQYFTASQQAVTSSHLDFHNQQSANVITENQQPELSSIQASQLGHNQQNFETNDSLAQYMNVNQQFLSAQMPPPMHNFQPGQCHQCYHLMQQSLTMHREHMLHLNQLHGENGSTRPSNIASPQCVSGRAQLANIYDQEQDVQTQSQPTPSKRADDLVAMPMFIRQPDSECRATKPAHTQDLIQNHLLEEVQLSSQYQQSQTKLDGVAVAQRKSTNIVVNQSTAQISNLPQGEVTVPLTKHDVKISSNQQEHLIVPERKAVEPVSRFNKKAPLPTSLKPSLANSGQTSQTKGQQLKKKVTMRLGFKFDPNRYDDDPKKAASAPYPFERPAAANQNKSSSKSDKQQRKKPALKIGYVYDPKRYDDDPAVASSAPYPFQKGYQVQPKKTQNEEVKKAALSNASLRKKPTLRLGFKFNPKRYDDDPEKARDAPYPFEDLKRQTQAAGDSAKAQLKKKVTLRLGYKFNPERYDDDPIKAAQAPNPFDQTEADKESKHGQAKAAEQPAQAQIQAAQQKQSLDDFLAQMDEAPAKATLAVSNSDSNQNQAAQANQSQTSQSKSGSAQPPASGNPLADCLKKIKLAQKRRNSRSRINAILTPGGKQNSSQKQDHQSAKPVEEPEEDIFSADLIGEEGQSLKKMETQNVDRRRLKNANKANQVQQQQAKKPRKLRGRNHVDLLFLHASPNLFENRQKNRTSYDQVPQLDFLKESKTIKEALQDSEKEVVFRSKVATKNNFADVISLKPSVLHISCHGVRNNQQSMGQNYSSSQSVGHFLLFENIQGDGDLVSAQELGAFMKTGHTELEVVFVAACDSEEIGKIFQRNGAKHVICVESKRFVLDEAAIMFTKRFYNKLFSEQVNVCEAFITAKNDVQFKLEKSEANLFKLFTKDDSLDDEFQIDHQRKKVNHVCQPLPFLDEMREGQLKCLSDHNLIKILPLKLQNFKYRERDMSQLLKMLLKDKNRIVSILGLHGIGKSALARNTCHYVAERKLFTGGIIFIQLKGMSSFFSMLKLIMRDITKQLKLNAEQKRELENETFSQEAMIDFIINFFNGSISQNYIRQKHVNKRANNLFLICLDNAGQVIEHADEEFIDLLQTMHDSCPKLRLIITTNRDFGQLPGKTAIKPCLLQSLKNNDAVSLFFEHCGTVEDEDIFELILKDERFPYRKFIRKAEELHKKGHKFELTDEIKQQVKIQIQQGKAKQMLAHHDMFRHLLGNPTSITMLASILQNPNHLNSLVELYENIKEETGLVVNEYQQNFGKGGGQVKERFVNNIMSLNVAAEMSVKLLEVSNKEDTNLLYFLGCLPGGVTPEQLTQMWGEKTTESLERLQQQPFFEFGADKHKLMLTPTMINYIDTNMDLVSKQDYMHYICEFYLENLQKAFKEIGRVGFETENAINDAKSTVARETSTQQMRKRLSINLTPQLNRGETGHTEIDILNFEEAMDAELRNIEYCINFLIEASAVHKTDEKTQIQTSESFLSNQQNEESKASLAGGSQVASSAAEEGKQLQPQLTMKQRELRKLEMGVNNEEYRQAFNIDGSVVQKSKIVVNQQLMRRQTSRKVKTKKTRHKSKFLSLKDKLGLAFRQKLIPIVEDDENESKSSVSTESMVESDLDEKESEEQKASVNESTVQKKLTNETSFDQKNYHGVIKLNIGEEEIASESEGSFGSDSEFERGSEVNTSFDQNNEKSKAGPIDTEEIVGFDQAVKVLQSILKQALNQKVKRIKQARGVRCVTSEDFSKTQIAVDQLRSQFLSSIKTRRRVELIDRKKSTTTKDFSVMDNFSALGDNQSQQLQFRHSITTTKSMASIWTPMTIEGQFILLMVADTYLSHDYEYSLRLATTDFSFIANTCLFEGNILRFRALANLKLFEEKFKDGVLTDEEEDSTVDDEEQTFINKECFEYLTAAIASLENSLSIFQVKETISKVNQNHYGVALALFGKAYIYEKYAEYLTRSHDKFGSKNCMIEYQKHLVDDVRSSYAKASHLYNKAFKSFDRVEHLKGKQLCKKKIYELLPEDAEGAIRDNEYQSMKLHQRNYEHYCKKYDVSMSCHINRLQHGEEISILSELVYRQHDPAKPLFPKTCYGDANEQFELSSEDSNESDDLLGSQKDIPNIQVAPLAKARSSLSSTSYVELAQCIQDGGKEVGMDPMDPNSPANKHAKRLINFKKRAVESMVIKADPFDKNGLINSDLQKE